MFSFFVLHQTLVEDQRPILVNREGASILRLEGILLLEQHEDWLAGRRYICIDSFGMPEDFPDEVLMSADLEPECVTLRLHIDERSLASFYLEVRQIHQYC